jgi:hypothetical protein
MAAWIGPAIIAALISGGISLIGLYLGGWITIRHDNRRRKEKVRDFQVALRAEILADIHGLRMYDLDQHLENIKRRYETDNKYVVKPSLAARQFFADTLAKEIHILPESVIQPVILYFRQKEVIERFVEDMRSSDFRERDRPTQLEMYEDYVQMKKVELELARVARDSIEASLDYERRFNSPALGR